MPPDSERRPHPAGQGEVGANRKTEQPVSYHHERNQDNLARALEFAGRGIPVFPCAADKRPAIPKSQGGRGFRDAATDPAEVRRMFSHRYAVLVGVPTGERSGLDVLDVDYRNGGAAFERANLHRLPETRIHQTKSGGRHFLFLHAPGVRNSASGIAPGIDVRGEGGYVIFPPSAGIASSPTLSRCIGRIGFCHWCCRSPPAGGQILDRAGTAFFGTAARTRSVGARPRADCA